jgi:hypothetical protein
MRERIVLIHTNWYKREDKLPDLKVEVEYVPAQHWSSDEGRKAYDIVIDGEVVGKITREIENTDTHYGRIRIPGKGRPAWGWTRAKKKAGETGNRNAPGMYEHNRRSAVAKILGYSYAEKEKA